MQIAEAAPWMAVDRNFRKGREKMNAAKWGLGLLALGMLSACGGGGGGDDGGGNNPPPSNYTPGVFQPSASFANQCVSPRTGTNPATGAPYADRTGSRTAENNFLRSWTNELYLWYSEVPDLNPANYDTLSYFDELKTAALSPSGEPKDKFHFTYDSMDWFLLSQSGVAAGYGAQWIVLAGTPPRQIVVAYTEPNSPATAAGLQRGDEVVLVDGADAINGNSQAIVDTLNAGLFPEDSGRAHTFRIRKVSGATVDVSMTSAEVTSDPVQNVATIPSASGPVGYLLFNDHIATAEGELIDAVNALDAQGITDLVLDIRYNGGGYLDIASQLAYMIAGNTRTSGQPFERINFNDKHTSTNPVTGQPLTPTPFHRTTLDFSEPPGAALPTLDLNRVYVITSSGTCSASEAIINGLRGVDVEVYQIGSTTCGKPYGFYARDNCGITYFSIQFKGVNAKGFGDYTDGFSPNNVTSGIVGERIPGCQVADDLGRALGDPNERRLAAALSFRASNNQTCPAASGFAPGTSLKPGQLREEVEGLLYRTPWRENRILRDM
jgi:carboxyl-terminal processing protease